MEKCCFVFKTKNPDNVKDHRPSSPLILSQKYPKRMMRPKEVEKIIQKSFYKAINLSKREFFAPNSIAKIYLNLGQN